MKPRKHAELIKAWADGATIERLWNDHNDKESAWLIDNDPDWSEFEEYRIKLDLNTEQQKRTLYIYNNFEEGKTWITPYKLNQAHENKRYCQYMGSIEVCK